MKIEGHIYKRNAAVLFRIEEDVMEVLVISSIYIINRTKVFFKGKCYDLNNYNRHFRAHILTNLNKETQMKVYIITFPCTHATQEYFRKTQL